MQVRVGTRGTRKLICIPRRLQSIGGRGQAGGILSADTFTSYGIVSVLNLLLSPAVRPLFHPPWNELAASGAISHRRYLLRFTGEIIARFCIRSENWISSPSPLQKVERLTVRHPSMVAVVAATEVTLSGNEGLAIATADRAPYTLKTEKKN